MSSSQENIEIVKNFLAVAASDETVGMFELIDKDATLNIPPSFPWGGVYRGHSGFQKGLAAFAHGWKMLTFDHEIVAGDQAVVMLSRVKADFGDGKPEIETELAELFRIENGKIVEIRPFYFDTAQISKKFEAQKLNK